MPISRTTRRRLISYAVLAASSVAALLGVVMLAWILGDVALKGATAINWTFFAQLPTPPGIAGGGLGNAILGTFLMTVTAALIAVPIGVMAGIYLSEFGRYGFFGQIIRSLADILISAPSIVIGVFVYLIMVKTMGHFSGWAGAVSLAILMLPVVIRTSEEMLRLVPNEMREAALAIGAPYWNMMLNVIIRSAKTGIITGVILAVARVAGETAPLLFTALNNPYWSQSMNEPMANLTVTLFNYAMSPYDDWHRLAWGAAFLITIAVLTVNILTRLLLRNRSYR
jgi:phosphate transport system permease protein